MEGRRSGKGGEKKGVWGEEHFRRWFSKYLPLMLFRRPWYNGSRVRPQGRYKKGSDLQYMSWLDVFLKLLPILVQIATQLQAHPSSRVEGTAKKEVAARLYNVAKELEG